MAFSCHTSHNSSKLRCCRDKVPKSYIELWALSEDVELSEEGQIVIRGSNLNPHE